MASSRTSSSGQQAPGQELEDSNRMTTHHGRPSVEAILNSVLPHWDGSLTLPSTFAIQNHRNMLLQVFWPEEKLRPVTGNAVHAAPDALPAVPLKWQAPPNFQPMPAQPIVAAQPVSAQPMVGSLPVLGQPVVAFLPVPGQPNLYRRMVIQPPTSTNTSPGSSSY